MDKVHGVFFLALHPLLFWLHLALNILTHIPSFLLSSRIVFPSGFISDYLLFYLTFLDSSAQLFDIFKGLSSNLQSLTLLT